MWPFKYSFEFTLKNSLFGAVKLTKNADPEKYKYSGYETGFDVSRTFFSSNCSGFGKSGIIFAADMSLSARIDNRK